MSVSLAIVALKVCRGHTRGVMVLTDSLSSRVGGVESSSSSRVTPRACPVSMSLDKGEMASGCSREAMMGQCLSSDLGYVANHPYSNQDNKHVVTIMTIQTL